MADLVESELLGLFFQRRDQALVEANGGAAFAADDVVMVVTGLLGKVEGFPAQNDALNQAGFAKGLEDAIDGGPVADLRPHFGKNLLRGEGGGGLCEGCENPPAAGGGFQTGPAKGVFFSRMAMTH